MCGSATVPQHALIEILHELSKVAGSEFRKAAWNSVLIPEC
jgi:hypothetical protein